MLKKCKKCGLYKDISDFHADSHYADKLKSSCKTCYNKNTNEWMKNNRKKVNESKKVWRLKNIKKVTTWTEKWKLNNKEKLSESFKKWAKDNPNSNRIRHQNRRFRCLVNGGKLSKNIAEKLFKLQKGKCACCGKSLGKNYHLDHIVPLYLGGVNEDKNIQLLKDKCNLSKGSKHPINYMQKKGFLL